jgi:hypothetical protein
MEGCILYCLKPPVSLDLIWKTSEYWSSYLNGQFRFSIERRVHFYLHSSSVSRNGTCRMFGWAWCKLNCNKTGSIFEDDPITFISRTRPCSHEFSIQLFLRFMLCDELDSRNCNIEEESISSDLGCLSSLRLLNPSGNNFPTLHASFRGVSKLERLYMDNRKRLEVSD